MQFISLRKSIASILVITMSSLTAGSFAPPASAQAEFKIPLTIIRLGLSVGRSIGNTITHDDAKREAFTQEFVTEATQNYPNYNVVISHNGGTVEGNVIHQHVELGMAVGTCGYEVYMAPKGQHFKFVRNGDGGFINWAYAGNFSRNDNTILAN